MEVLEEYCDILFGPAHRIKIRYGKWSGFYFCFLEGQYHECNGDLFHWYMES